MAYIYPIGLLGALGFLFALLLAIASEVFAVEVDPTEEAVLGALPGVNCGACGYPGCAGMAKAIVSGDAPVNGCPVGGEPVAEEIGKILGVAVEAGEKSVACVLCQGDCDKAKSKYKFQGLQDCRAENVIQGGSKACEYGCLGCGTCKDVCEFGAVEIVNGLAVINKDKCVACGRCIEECPKNLIELVPYSADYIVKCNNKNKGPGVRPVCEIGCIGCTMCVQKCPKDAIAMDGFLAKIDYDKCIRCSICAGVCPTKAIYPGMTKKEQMELEKGKVEVS